MRLPRPPRPARGGIALPQAPGGPPSAPLDALHADRLVDSFGRRIRDLRLSITDRCNFRCVYCMDPDVRFAPAGELLTIDEHIRIARVAVGLGVTKVRITGGEPALHPGLIELLQGLKGLGLTDIAMTTNGSLMDTATARRWREAGLTRITLSLDSLRPERFAAITRSDSSVEQVLAAIEAAREARLEPVRVNAVVVRGFNEDELPALASMARRLDVDVRLIEYMPLDSAHAWEREKVVPADEMIARIESVHALEPIGRDTTSSPATTFRFRDSSTGRIGIIASVTHPFCGNCSRLRITADGKVRPCLFSNDEWDIRPLLRPVTPAESSTDADIARFLADATWAKQSGHSISSPDFRQPDRPMSAIGG